MKILSLASRKGGSGKTTLTVHLAVEALRAGVGSVAILDLDQQHSASAWYERREPEQPLLIQTTHAELGEHLQACEDAGVDLVVIDTTPDVRKEAYAAIARSNLVLVPTRPSIMDLLSIGATVDTIKELGVPGAIIVNQATPRATVNRESEVALQGYGLDLAPVQIAMRLSYQRSLITGQTVAEIAPGGKGAREMSKAWRWVQDLMGIKLGERAA